jgi:predicted N-formylglutamate amidohydrolase
MTELQGKLQDQLLTDADPAPVTVANENASSPFLLVADHGGNIIPRRLGDLGVSAAERERHIAWDIGIAGVSRHLAAALDATLIQQNYSRLVIDCNRPPRTPESMPEISERTPVPGNVALSEADVAARITEIFRPYHDKIERELDRRQQAGQPAVLISMHSFTPRYMDVARPWHIGLLYNRDVRFARYLKALLEREAGLVIGDREPYTVDDETDYTIPVHGEKRGLHHVAIEIRQDLIADEKGQRSWALLLARLLPQAYQALRASETF